MEWGDYTYLLVGGICRRAEGARWMGLQQVLNVGKGIRVGILNGSKTADIG